MDNQSFYVVEDMGVTRAAIVSVLKRAGFYWAGSSASAENAWIELQEKQVAVAIIDISLKGAKNGIWLAQKIKAHSDCAVIFLTAYGSDALLEKIYDTEPDGYIMKPFNNPTLISAVTMACRKRSKQQQEQVSASVQEDTVVIKSRKTMVKINKAEVVYLKSDGNYVQLYTTNLVYEIRGKLSEVIAILDTLNLFRVHRRFAVNSDKVKAIDNHTIYTLTNQELPFSKSFQYDELIASLKKNVD